MAWHVTSKIALPYALMTKQPSTHRPFMALLHCFAATRRQTQRLLQATQISIPILSVTLHGMQTCNPPAAVTAPSASRQNLASRLPYCVVLAWLHPGDELCIRVRELERGSASIKDLAQQPQWHFPILPQERIVATHYKVCGTCGLII